MCERVVFRPKGNSGAKDAIQFKSASLSQLMRWPSIASSASLTIPSSVFSFILKENNHLSIFVKPRHFRETGASYFPTILENILRLELKSEI